MPDANYPAVIPTGDDYKAMQDNGQRWRVNVSSFGGLLEGSVVGVKDFQPGCNLQYFIDNGTLGELTEAEAKNLLATSPKINRMAYHQDEPLKVQVQNPMTDDIKVETVPAEKPAPALSTPPAKVDGRTTRHQQN